MAAVAESQAAAEIVKGEVLEVKERAVALVSVIAAETAVAEEKLAAAKPALDAAEAALQVLFWFYLFRTICTGLAKTTSIMYRIKYIYVFIQIK